ncbi:MAG: hypothetical protein ACKOUM_04685, partial [Sphingopyxis sp.]
MRRQPRIPIFPLAEQCAATTTHPGGDTRPAPREQIIQPWVYSRMSGKWLFFALKMGVDTGTQVG